MANFLSLSGIRKEIVGDLLTCPLCYEKYDDCQRVAKFLPCLHGFCVDCLARHAGTDQTFDCPMCRRETRVPAAGVQDLPDNFVVKKLKDLEHLLDVDVSRPRGLGCGSCGDGEAAAVSFCSDADCLAFLCENCTDAHRRLKIFQGHVVSSMEQLQERPEIPMPRQKLQCNRHNQHVMSVFCNDRNCQEAMCLVCSSTVHRNHNVVDLDQKSAEVKQDLQRLTQEARNKVQPVRDINMNIGSEMSHTRDLLTDLSTKVATVFDDLQRQLKDRRDAVIAELNKLTDERIKHLQHQAESAESLASQLESACQFAERACEIGNPLDLLQTREQVIFRLRELGALDIETYLSFQPAIPLFPMFTTYHAHVFSEIKMLVPHLGQFVGSAVEAVQIPRLKVDFPGQVGSPVPVKTTHRVHIRADDPSYPSLESLVGQLHVYLQSPDGSTTKCDDGRHCNFFEFEFQPLVVGLHHLSISVSGAPITGSPFDVNVVERTSSGADLTASDDQAIDLTLTDAFARCEHTIFFKLRCPIPHDSRVWAQYSMPDHPDTYQHGTSLDGAGVNEYCGFLSRPIQREVKMSGYVTATEENGTYRIVYIPPAAGRLIMTILQDIKPFKGTPFDINVNPLYPDSTLVSAAAMGKHPQLTAVLGMPYSLTLLTHDYRGRRLTIGGYNVTASVTSSSSPEATVTPDIKDNQDGSYEATFTPRGMEPHILAITICGYPVKPGMSLVIPVQDSLPFEDPPDGYTSPSGLAIDVNKKIVFIADAKGKCIHLFATDGRFMHSRPIDVALRKIRQMAVSADGKLVLLAPHSRCVITCGTTGEEGRWSCAKENSKPATLAVLPTGTVVVGDSESETLFLYRSEGGIHCRIQLPTGSLAAGMNNVCPGSQGDILVATHSEPHLLLRFSPSGDMLSKEPSPARSNQLAAAATPDGLVILAVVDAILVVDPGHALPVREFQTNHIYTGLALADDGCFVALDPGEKHLAKYSYALGQSTSGYSVQEEMTV